MSLQAITITMTSISIKTIDFRKSLMLKERILPRKSELVFGKTRFLRCTLWRDFEIHGQPAQSQRQRPALENLPRRKPRGLGSTYGGSVQAVAVTAASGVLLKVCMAPKTEIITPDDPRNAERSGVIAIMFRVEDGWAQPVVTGSTVGGR